MFSIEFLQNLENIQRKYQGYSNAEDIFKDELSKVSEVLISKGFSIDFENGMMKLYDFEMDNVTKCTISYDGVKYYGKHGNSSNLSKFRALIQALADYLKKTV